MEKIKKYIDFGFKKTDLIAVFGLVFCLIAIKLLNLTEIYENTLIENIQLIPLIIGGLVCFRTKEHKNFYIIIGLLLILFFFRELSYGRVFYGEIPDNPHNFYPLSHFKYGYLTNIIIAIYLAGIALFGIIKKVWIDIYNIVKTVKFPIWSFLFAAIFIILEIFGEKFDNTIIEEIAELTIYCYCLSICLIYTNKENK